MSLLPQVVWPAAAWPSKPLSTIPQPFLQNRRCLALGPAQKTVFLLEYIDSLLLLFFVVAEASVWCQHSTAAAAAADAKPRHRSNTACLS